MTRYVALVDGKPGSYGLTVPDLSGCTSAAATTDEVLHRATEAVRLWAGTRLPMARNYLSRARSRHSCRSRSGGGACKGRRFRDRTARPRCGPAGRPRQTSRSTPAASARSFNTLVGTNSSNALTTSRTADMTGSAAIISRISKLRW
jgi:predicted RNase H-like HicB family nuclease